jgi:shikimate dehydrogenase
MAKAGYDLIYNPAVTPFMKELLKRDIPVYNGLTMLLYQGIIAYELWNDISVPDELADRVLTSLRRKIYGENIILVGYMGSGKTTIGQKLAEKRHMKFLDTDQYIEEQEGIQVSDIFQRVGEAGFRKIETETLKRLSGSCYNTVISTGGGMVLKQENRELLQEMGTVYFLDVSPEEIYNRLKGDTTRPLLAGGSAQEIRERIHSMLEKRMGYYIAAADSVIAVDGRSVDTIINKISSDWE